MNCPKCGAPLEENKCIYCGYEEKTISDTNNSQTVINNYYSEPKTNEKEPTVINNYYTIPESNNKVVREDRTVSKIPCPRCDGTNIEISREYNQTTDKRKQKSEKGYKTIALCKDCGYTWEPNYDRSSDKKSCGWYLLVILFYPISLPYLFITTNKISLPKWLRVVIVIVVYALIYMGSSGNL